MSVMEIESLVGVPFIQFEWRRPDHKFPAAPTIDIRASLYRPSGTDAAHYPTQHHARFRARLRPENRKPFYGSFGKNPLSRNCMRIPAPPGFAHIAGQLPFAETTANPDMVKVHHHGRLHNKPVKVEPFTMNNMTAGQKVIWDVKLQGMPH